MEPLLLRDEVKPGAPPEVCVARVGGDVHAEDPPLHIRCRLTVPGKAAVDNVRPLARLAVGVSPLLGRHYVDHDLGNAGLKSLCVRLPVVERLHLDALRPEISEELRTLNGSEADADLRGNIRLIKYRTIKAIKTVYIYCCQCWFLLITYMAFSLSRKSMLATFC